MVTPLKKIHGLTGNSVLSLAGSEIVSPLIQTLHLAFSQHYPVSLKPEVLWYTISSEMAKHIKYNSEKYKKLFNGDPKEKKIIRTEDNSLIYGCGMEKWLPAMELYRPLLAENIPTKTQNMFLPDFSTADQTANLALLMSFMDAASPYYDYRMRTMCGIPRIRLEGSKEDWKLLISKTSDLQKVFTDLDPYFSNLIPVLESITAAFDGQIDEKFWMSIYKKGGGSGGPYVHGWITAFVVYVNERLKRNFDWKSFRGLNVADFPTHISQIDFIWEYYGQEIPMNFVGGIVEVTQEDGFLTPKLGVGVIEKVS